MCFRPMQAWFAAVLLATSLVLPPPGLSADAGEKSANGIVDKIADGTIVHLRTKEGFLALTAESPKATEGLHPGDDVTVRYVAGTGERPKALYIGLRRASVDTSWAVGAMGVGVLVFLLIAAGVLKCGGLQVRRLIIGEDGRTSNSKVQAVIWFAILVASYVATFLTRLALQGWQYIGGIDIAQSLFVLSGISAGTFVGAKGITVARVASGAPKTPAPAATAADLFTNDRNQFDLADFQSFAWALLAAGVYLFQMVAFLKALPLGATVQLPTLDSTLLSFFGLGQGAYLAKKAVGEPQTRIGSVTPPEAPPGATVTISGSGFGEDVGYARFGTAMARVIAWHDASVSVQVPSALRPGRMPLQLSLAVKPATPDGQVGEVRLPPVPFSVVQGPLAPRPGATN